MVVILLMIFLNTLTQYWRLKSLCIIWIWRYLKRVHIIQSQCIYVQWKTLVIEWLGLINNSVRNELTQNSWYLSCLLLSGHFQWPVTFEQKHLFRQLKPVAVQEANWQIMKSWHVLGSTQRIQSTCSRHHQQGHCEMVNRQLVYQLCLFSPCCVQNSDLWVCHEYPPT